MDVQCLVQRLLPVCEPPTSMAAAAPAAWAIDAERLVQAPGGVPVGAALVRADYRLGRHVVEGERESWWWLSDCGQGLAVEYHEKLPRRVASVSRWAGGRVLRAACWRVRRRFAPVHARARFRPCTRPVFMHAWRRAGRIGCSARVQAKELGVEVAYLYPGPNWAAAVISRDQAAVVERMVADVDKPVVVTLGLGGEEVSVSRG